MKQQQSQEPVKRSQCRPSIYQVQTSFPASEVTQKSYSLQADMVTGWRPKTRIAGPIPFNFDSLVVDEVIDELTSFGSRYQQRVVYLGNRYQSSFKVHEQMKHKYRFKYESMVLSNFSQMAAYFRKFHANFKSKKAAGRLFKGMNPTIKADELIFDSNFESGNLDAVIKVSQNQYDLFMRIDTNTRGHLQWFNFTIKNNGKKKIKLNIVNLRKSKSLYNRSMKPYIYSEHLKQTKDISWHQGCQNVKYTREKLRYAFLADMFEEEVITFNCLKFQYNFETDWETVQISYSPPWTYSELLQKITQLKKQVQAQSETQDKNFLQQTVLCESLGGLDLPLLTITDPLVQDKNKRCILISARIHPGETCGSHMLNGFLNFICSNSEIAIQMRKQIVFKVVPMLNPDGVVIGNFRTSLCGRDLNRQFRNSSDFLIPEVKGLKQLVIGLKAEFKGRLIFFLDFHGHSVKKNVFLYGPEYEIWQNNYYKTRIFPKLLASKTEMFRYYSCLFRIADFKRTTARAVILNNVPHCYTIQASTGFFYSSQSKKDIPFTPVEWGKMGQMIGECIGQYIDLMYDEEMSKQQRRQKLNQLKSNKVKSKQKVEKKQVKNGNFQTRLVSLGSVQKDKEAPGASQKIEVNKFHNLSQRARDLIEKIKQEEQKNKAKEQGHQSDGFSQGGSDSEGQQDDIPDDQLKKLHACIIDSMDEFRKNFATKDQRQYSYKQSRKKTVGNSKKNRQSVKLKNARQSKGIQMIASLRKKAEQMEKMQQVFKWPKVREDSKSFTTGINRQMVPVLTKNKTKMNFKAYLDHMEGRTQIKHLRSNGSGFLEVNGEGKQFKDTNLTKN